MSRSLSPVPNERLLETPGDLERLVRELLPLLADGTLLKVDDDSPASAGVELEALLGPSRWPDLIDAKFVDRSGRGYHLFVDVFHGSGGRWSRIAAP